MGGGSPNLYIFFLPGPEPTPGGPARGGHVCETLARSMISIRKMKTRSEM